MDSEPVRDKIGGDSNITYMHIDTGSSVSLLEGIAVGIRNDARTESKEDMARCFGVVVLTLWDDDEKGEFEVNHYYRGMRGSRAIAALDVARQRMLEFLL